MSPGDILVTATDGLPRYELEFRFDDPADPEEVTVFDDGDVTTAWITARVEDAASLDEVA